MEDEDDDDYLPPRQPPPEPSKEPLEVLLDLRPGEFGQSRWLAIQSILVKKGYRLLTELEDNFLQIELGWYAKEFVHDKDAERRLVSYYDNVINGRLVADDGQRPSLKTRLVFKLVDTRQSNEIEILRSLQRIETEALGDSCNRTIPFVNDIVLSPTRSILIMEEWGGKLLDLEKLVEFEYFVQQMLETISFIHEQGVAHCDIAPGNITMGPLGYVENHLDICYDLQRGKKPPFLPKYVLLDFQLAERRPKCETGPFLKTRNKAGQLLPPENSSTKAYDLFSGDIYSLGRTFRGVSINSFEHVNHPERENISVYLQPLWDRMTDVDPNKRPTAREALDLFKTMRRTKDPPRPLYLESNAAGEVDNLSLGVEGLAISQELGR
ncbi:kinase-like protein [Meredithblackwellia eburnea MCA 4105]